MFGNEFARALMNTHAVQKNKGESGDDTVRRGVCVSVCVSLFYFIFSPSSFTGNTCMQLVPRTVKSG